MDLKNIILNTPTDEKEVGDDEMWDKSEAALLDAIKKSKLEYTINKGGVLFMGQEIEFVLRDAIGKRLAMWNFAS